MSIVSTFLDRVQKTYKTNKATEHSYRSDLQSLFSSIDNHISALNEPKRVACGAPDFLIQSGDIVIGHAEAKDIGVGLRNMKDSNRHQQQRYLAALPNLIYTNCLDWDFYRNGQLVSSVTIADLLMGIQPKPDQFAVLENLLREFITQRLQTITAPRHLAEIMAGKAALIKDVLRNALHADKDHQTDLSNQYNAFKEHLIHDITPEEFADIYAETIAYGMFAARLHDTTLDNFDRKEALELLPKSNPFLRSLFGYIAGPDLDDRIKWIIDDLAKVFQAANVKKIMEGFGKLTGQQDPFLHFYETFLAAYNPAKRKARGVWYTPEAVVNFIVHSVDRSLKADFDLPDGIADTSKVVLNWDTGQNDKKGKPIKIKKEVHRVQILDPATGTGTFLAEVIKQIAPKVKDVASGMWSQYVERDLIPRVHGFELLMASYAMCHMKLDMILTELGYKPTGAPPRLSVYLTNSLEEGEPANQTLPFAQWLSNEVKQANTIKRDMPIMCVIGNPPYNPSSKNNNPWIAKKMLDYKKGLNDRKINLNDDYMKFIRFAEDLIGRSGEGVVAMITNNSFLDGTTQRIMRAHLMNTFQMIDIFNLHGDIRSQQSDPTDENVFDITQGVSIVIMRKTRSKEATKVRYADIIGRRVFKTACLVDHDGTYSNLEEIRPEAPYFFFVPKDAEAVGDDFSLDTFFPVKSSGIQTKNDEVAISWTSAERDAVVSDFQHLSEEQLLKKYPPMKVWDTIKARKDIISGDYDLRSINYRPFDTRYTVLTKKSGGFLGRPRYDVMQHIAEGDLSLVVNKKHVGDTFSHATVASSLVAHGVHYLGNRGQDFACPVYLAADEIDTERRVNFNTQIFARLQTLSQDDTHDEADEIDVFDYIYGTLYSPSYKARYSESLKIGFPRIPWPADASAFWSISAKGAKLRHLHLMEPAAIGDTPYPFKGEGDGTVDLYRYQDGKVFISKHQFFDNVPQAVWELNIGGYQPAEKWLKDRKGRTLVFDDIRNYQKIIKAMYLTIKIVGEMQT
jgi:predicted helicase